jgi:NADPH:quinone reductase-like Zn-dependent oxidoreductase
MKAFVFEGQSEGLHFRENHPDPQPQPGQVVVRLRAAALNHRDVWITQGMYPGIVAPVILGSDGAGEYQGRQVLINPNIGWGPDPRFPAKSYSILGMPVNGALAEYVAVGEDRLHDLPAHLNLATAAALPLGGLTAYRAVFTRGRLKAGERMLVTGAGGGVALLAVQFGLAAGAGVYITTGHADKLAKTIALGAAGGVNYRDADWDKQLLQQAGGPFDLIIDSAGGEGFNALVKLAAPGGRIVTYGGGQGAVPKFSPQAVFWKQLDIMGTSMGSDEDFVRMLDFVGRHRIQPVIDSEYPLHRAAEAFERMRNGLQFGKIIISI